MRIMKINELRTSKPATVSCDNAADTVIRKKPLLAFDELERELDLRAKLLGDSSVPAVGDLAFVTECCFIFVSEFVLRHFGSTYSPHSQSRPVGALVNFLRSCG